MNAKLLLVPSIAFLLASCGGNGNAKKFAPEQEQEKLTVEERAEKIQTIKDKKTLNAASLLSPRELQLSVMVPTIHGSKVSKGMDERIAVKMLQIAAENGISGMGISSAFVLGAEVNQVVAEVTATVPQRMVVKYEIVYSVINIADGTVYATCSEDVTGAGASFERAELNVVSNLKNTSKIQKMLATASERIINWYNDNLPELKSRVETARSEGNYALALALVNAVPQKAAQAFEYADEIRPALIEEYKKKSANDNLCAMLSLIASSNDEFDPAVGGYLSLIPLDSPQYEAANKAFGQYENKCRERMKELEARAEKDAEAARQLELMRMNFEQQKELAKIEADKVVGKAEARANAVAMERADRAESEKGKGFWSKFGSRVLNGFDAIGSKLSGDDDDD